jgi:bifunctional DNA-binding transcriptional regulator/antitoxin component of YhaV-PrlF toxin-antitoxin module
MEQNPVSEIRVAKITSNDASTPSVIYIPKVFQKALGLQKGCYVKIFIKDGRLIIEPLNFNTKPPTRRKLFIKSEGGPRASHFQEPASADLKTEVSHKE